MLFALTAILSLSSAFFAVCIKASASSSVQSFTVYDWNGTPARTVTRMEAAVAWQSDQLQRYWKTPRVRFVGRRGLPVYLVSVRTMRTAAAGDAGFHGQRSGQPYAVVSSAGAGWQSVTFSHEIMETLVDPLTDHWTTVDLKPLLQEVCDPVENDSYSAPNGVALSDAITPAWYVSTSQGPWDLAGSLTEPGEVQGALEFL